MRRYTSLTIRFLLIFIFFLSSILGCQPYAFKKQIEAEVNEVIDGDTIALTAGKVVRYIGIDAPETKKFHADEWIEVNEPFSKIAKDFNEQLVGGKTLRLEFDVERTDKYERLLAYCFVDDIFVNERLLEEGLALLYTRVPNVKYVDVLVAAQKKARLNQKGLWREEKFITAEQAKDYVGSIATIEGKVLNVGESKHCFYLNFGKDFRSDFTVVIFKKDLSTFIGLGISPQKYEGRIIRTFGKIKEYNGPEIVVRHPCQIEIVR